MENNIISTYRAISELENRYYSDVTYPSELFWQEKTKTDMEDLWTLWIQDSNIQYILNVHIPFCAHKCDFCTHAVTGINDSIVIENYLDFLEEQAKSFRETFVWISFKILYISGWTPSILSVQQLKRLYGIIEQNFNLSEVHTHMFEGTPNSFSPEKIQLLAKHGVNKVTFGIQDIDENLLKNNHRYQSREKIGETVNLLHANNIHNISVDIMAWLDGQTFEQFKETLDYTNNLGISNICLNIFRPTIQTEYTKRWGVQTPESLEEIDSMQEYYKTNNTKKYSWEELYPLEIPNTSCLSLGYGWVNHIFWRGYYKAIKKPSDGHDNVYYKGININKEEEIVRYILDRLGNKGVSFNNVSSLFWGEIKQLGLYDRFMVLVKKGLITSTEKEGKTYFQFAREKSILYWIYSKILYNPDIISLYNKEHWDVKNM